MRDAEIKLNILRELLVSKYYTADGVWQEIDTVACTNCGKRLNDTCPVEDGGLCDLTPEQSVDTYLELMLKEMKGEKK